MGRFFHTLLSRTRARTPAPRRPYEVGDTMHDGPHPLTRYDMAVAQWRDTGRIYRSWAGSSLLDRAEIDAERTAARNYAAAKRELFIANQERIAWTR